MPAGARPERRAVQRLLNYSIYNLCRWHPARLNLQPRRNVVADRHGGKGRGPLKNHSDVAAQRNSADCPVVNVLPLKQHLPFNPRAWHGFVHSVQAP
jgi:hypothetical protein